MNFPYLNLPGDLGDTPRPLVPVIYKSGNKETKPILTLIDSGADYSYVTFKIAEYLDIKFNKIEPVSITGFEGSSISCWPFKTTIEVANGTLFLPIYYGGS